MDFIKDNTLLIYALLLILLFGALVIIYIQQQNLQQENKSKGKGKNGTSGFVPKDKYTSAVEKCNKNYDAYKAYKKKYESIEKDYTTLQRKKNEVDDQYGKLCIDYSNLKQELESLKLKNDELTRENAELNKLVGNEPEPVVKEEENPPVENPTKEEPKQENTSTEVKEVETASTNKEPEQTQEPEVVVTIVEPEPEPEPEVEKNDNQKGGSKETIMYASFPRSASNFIYFSDLTENRTDDSYFELKISQANGKATFKPLDFMKIRNYDDAMVAMRTEGVKATVASTVCGIEPGKAHKDGNDWIIDNLAKIKLA